MYFSSRPRLEVLLPDRSKGFVLPSGSCGSLLINSANGEYMPFSFEVCNLNGDITWEFSSVSTGEGLEIAGFTNFLGSLNYSL